MLFEVDRLASSISALNSPTDTFLGSNMNSRTVQYVAKFLNTKAVLLSNFDEIKNCRVKCVSGGVHLSKNNHSLGRS